MSSNSKSKSVRSVKKVKPAYVREYIIQLAIIVIVLGGVVLASVHYFPIKQTLTVDAVAAPPVVQTVFSESCKHRINEAYTNGFQVGRDQR